jgi:ubiquitin carboxyl-terminal hydrolase 48
MRYETTCDECGTRSYRHEKFRDLNLPIVEPPVSGKKGTLMDFFCSTNQDATVQDCLDRYCQAEDLAGDNQYHCSVCEKKCDARRQMSFTHLPHVLNIQLCRYVFDRKSLSKKKLSDKVLLPLELLVSSRKTEEQRRASSPSSSSRSHEDDSDEATTNRYLLCAVMRHLGNSAYSGHYVAEAMDWLTGQWYEFNDEQVTILESGPSCSFRQGQHVVPSTNIETTPPKGSKDAYNMYYVEESFLAQSIIDYMQELNPEQPQALKTPVTSTAEGWRAEAPNSEGQSGVLGQVKGERRAFYAELGRYVVK